MDPDLGDDFDADGHLTPAPRPLAVAARAVLPPDQREWTREPVDTSGMAFYMIMERSPADPPRRSREARHAAMGRAAASAEWKEIRKATVEQWAEKFLALLGDGRAVTLPTGGAAVRAWANPLAEWGARLRAAVVGRGNQLVRGRAGRVAA